MAYGMNHAGFIRFSYGLLLGKKFIVSESKKTFNIRSDFQLDENMAMTSVEPFLIENYKENGSFAEQNT